MDTSLLDDLVNIGKQSFEMINQTGTFYFPKVAIGRPGGDIQIAQYPSGFDEFQQVLAYVSQEPIEWLGHTADSWWYASTVNDPIVKDIDAGITTCEEQFEAGNPNAFEALSVLQVTADDAQGAWLPYRRTPQGIEWVEVDPDQPPPPFGRMVSAMHTAIRASHSILQ